MGADGADADVQLGGDLGVGAALGDQGDQFPFPGAELSRARRRGGCCGPGAVSIRAYSAAVARLIAAPRSSRRPRPGGPERLPGLRAAAGPGGARYRAVGASPCAA